VTVLVNSCYLVNNKVSKLYDIVLWIIRNLVFFYVDPLLTELIESSSNAWISYSKTNVVVVTGQGLTR
jgi:hypothetical protein